MKKYISLGFVLLSVALCLLLGSCGLDLDGGEEFYVSIDKSYIYGEQFGYDNQTINYDRVKEGTVIEEPELPEIEGYTFVGWKWRNHTTEEEGWWSFDTAITEDVVEKYGHGGSLHIFAIFTQDQFRYELTEDGAGYIAAELLYMPGEWLEAEGREVRSITVPDEYRGLPVIAVADGACEWSSWENIGIHGYADRLTIGKNVKTIGNRAFKGRVMDYYGGSIVEIPEGVTDIGAYAFSGCSVGELILPGTITKIMPYTFDNFSSWTPIVIPESVTDIRAYAFSFSHISTSDKDGEYTYEMIIPDSVTLMGEHVFYDSSITSITISANLECIPESAFESCDDLKTVIIPSGVTEIQDKAFSNTGLTSISLPDTLDYIGNQSFFSCMELSSVEIPEGCRHLGEEVFFNSLELTTISLPTTLTYIGKNAFKQTKFLTNIYNSDYSENLAYYGNYLIGRRYLASEQVIKDGTVLIASGVFEGDSQITTVSLPDSLKYIGDRAFYQCTALSAVSLSDNVLSIGRECFSWCSSLKSVRFSESLTEIPYYAFAGCKLGNIVIPEGVKSIGAYAFYRGGVTGVKLPSTLTAIPSYAFYGCAITEIDIPETVTIIMDYAFYGCQLKSLTLPTELNLYIMNSAFEGNIGITELYIPRNVTMIDPAAFYGCTGITSLTFGASEGGWRCINFEVGAAAGGNKSFTMSELSDPEVAAKYLTKDYAGYTWIYYTEE